YLYPLPSRQRGSQPIELREVNPRLAQRALRANDDAAVFRVEPQHVKRLGSGDPEPLTLADREMGDAMMAAQHPPVLFDDIARLAGFRPQSLDDRRIGSLAHEADVLAVGLGRDRQREIARQPAGLVLRQTTQRNA